MNGKPGDHPLTDLLVYKRERNKGDKSNYCNLKLVGFVCLHAL